MHDCPDCGMACYCDGEDHGNAAASKECTHSETEDCLQGVAFLVDLLDDIHDGEGEA